MSDQDPMNLLETRVGTLSQDVLQLRGFVSGMLGVRGDTVQFTDPDAPGFTDPGGDPFMTGYRSGVEAREKVKAELKPELSSRDQLEYLVGDCENILAEMAAGTIFSEDSFRDAVAQARIYIRDTKGGGGGAS